MRILGIDIGTTTITALLLDEKSGALIDKATLKNDSFIHSAMHYEKIQDPEVIIETVKRAIDEITDGSDVSAIGVTGQMHGILYLDANRNPVSPLYTWQDLRGNEIHHGNTTYADYLTETTKYKAATGFGLTTHYYNTKNHLVPKSAKKLCTIHDYLVSILTNQEPIMHSSNAASLGFYDLRHHHFDNIALLDAGIDPDILPKVVKNTTLAGTTDCDFLPSGIPVAVAIGDNQASFLGAVTNPDSSILVNVGTGSQVSFLTSHIKPTDIGEIRPLTDDDYIFVGSSLCGGRAYQILRNFFADCQNTFGGSTENIYEKMDELSESIDSIKNPLKVNCEFAGTRANPQKRGFIENISTENFTPTNLICGVLVGVVDELKDMYEAAADFLDFKPRVLVGSGNGIRKSRVWRFIFEKEFSLELKLPKHSEEAAVGACIFAATANGKFRTTKDAQKFLLEERL